MISFRFVLGIAGKKRSEEDIKDLDARNKISRDMVGIFIKGLSKEIYNSTTVIAKIKGMPRSLFYVIPRYVTMDYEK